MGESVLRRRDREMHSISMIRQYRDGPFPDVQISPSEVVRPLQELYGDPEVARTTFLLMLSSLFASLSDIRHKRGGGGGGRGGNSGGAVRSSLSLGQESLTHENAEDVQRLVLAHILRLLRLATRGQAGAGVGGGGGLSSGRETNPDAASVVACLATALLECYRIEPTLGGELCEEDFATIGEAARSAQTLSLGVALIESSLGHVREIVNAAEERRAQARRMQEAQELSRKLAPGGNRVRGRGGDDNPAHGGAGSSSAAVAAQQLTVDETRAVSAAQEANYQLSQLFRELGDKELVLTLFRRFCTQRRSHAALSSILYGDFKRAHDSLDELLCRNKRLEQLSEEEALRQWDGQQWPSRHEMDWWLNEALECCLQMADWGKVMTNVLTSCDNEPHMLWHPDHMKHGVSLRALSLSWSEYLYCHDAFLRFDLSSRF